MSSGYTLITGASMGIGKALAEECASRKMDLLLVALPGSELNMLAEEMQEKYGISVHVFGLDILAPGAYVKIHNWCKENAFPVDKLLKKIRMGGRSEEGHVGKDVVCRCRTRR